MKNLAVCSWLLLYTLCTFSSTAQETPIGYWNSILPYNTARSIASDGNTIFVATDLSMFTYDMVSKEMNAYSKVDGMSDIKMTAIGHDILTGTTILGYQNANIDLFKDNSFYNIPYLKLKSVAGSKNIYSIYADAGFAYLATDLGIIVINLDRREVKETFAFSQNNQSIPTSSFIAVGNYFYATTTKGMYRANRNNPNLQAQSSWTRLTDRDFFASTIYKNELYFTGVDSIFKLSADTMKYVYRTDTSVVHIDGGSEHLLVSTFKGGRGVVYFLDANMQRVDSITGGFPKQAIQFTKDVTAVADQYAGLRIRMSNETRAYIPPGPVFHTAFGLLSTDRQLFIAHGGYNNFFIPSGNASGVSQKIDGYWNYYSGINFAPFRDSMKDFVTVVKSPVDGSVWMGSWSSGLFMLKKDGTYKIWGHGSGLESKIAEPSVVPVTGIAFDRFGNAWITQGQAAHELAVYTKEGNLYHFDPPILGLAFPNSAAYVLIDEADQKWYCTPQGGSAKVVMYNDNGTIDNPSDDQYVTFGGNDIPGGQVLCMVLDKNGAIWMGTDDGIGRINCPEQVLTGDCKPEIPVVKYDQFAGQLFKGERVNAIAVDGANRKWIGTNNGVWLISSDADKIIYRFTATNSPLPSNVIQTIHVDGITGDVYIGTENGVISYRSTATDGGSENKDVKVFPNPVPSGYTGTVAINGLAENADLRITDITGQLVYRTKALGGQAVWNGLDYTGKRPQTGVYLIFVTNKDGSQKYKGKVAFIE